MLFDTLRASSSLTIDRFPSFEMFQPTELIGSARSIPLKPREFAVARATIRLKHCQLILQRSFERILETGYSTAGAFFLVPMSDDIEATMNGVALDGSSIVLVRGDVVCQTVERRPNVFAVVNVTTPLAGYDWFDQTDRVAFLTAEHELAQLQATIRTVFNLVSLRADIATIPGHVAALELALLTALDRIVAGGVARADKLRLLSRYRRIVQRVDDLIAGDPSAAIYTEDIASECGVSLRTVHNAMAAIRGHSLHRYLAVKRLSSVRRQLAGSGGQLRIGQVAREHGFWHLGEFGALYRRHFGETPAQTRRDTRTKKLMA